MFFADQNKDAKRGAEATAAQRRNGQGRIHASALIRSRLLGMLISLMPATIALGHNAPVDLEDALSASFQRMQIAYACRESLGTAPYDRARVTAENLFRTAGIGTVNAVRKVATWEVTIERSTMRLRKIDIGSCLQKVTASERKLAHLTQHLRENRAIRQ